LSEYDQTGSCVRDYIYAGNRLLAEYRPSTGKYYYYMSDQINSTRIITDDVGNVVYSEAYGPYGDVQKTWTKTYDPKQKFSGKEREGYSELDYFGARYFDNNSYRFISVDPIINKEGAIANSQLWNLYAYCRNNPITKFDPDGRQDADYLAQALAAQYLDNNTDISAQEYYQIVDIGSGFGAATGFAFIAGYFAPEITVSLTSAISNYADKFQRGIDSWNRNKSTAEKIYKNLEGQLKNDGVKSIYKTLKGHQKALAEHLGKLKNGLEYESQVKSTISRINIAIKTTEKFIKDKGLK
ncbi:MAG: hypothetical protein QG657_4227, partial [Acidobacteriota bacterium]|nr:hypothetical protein [Acidobacteriota bacterium]